MCIWRCRLSTWLRLRASRTRRRWCRHDFEQLRGCGPGDLDVALGIIEALGDEGREQALAELRAAIGEIHTLKREHATTVASIKSREVAVAQAEAAVTAREAAVAEQETRLAAALADVEAKQNVLRALGVKMLAEVEQKDESA